MINKQSLIELYESKILIRDIRNFFIQNSEGDSINIDGVEYYESPVNINIPKEKNKIFEDDGEYTQKKAIDTYCRIYVFNENNGKFFIGFNSLKTEINQEEYIYIKEMVDLRKKNINEMFARKKQQIDLQLLELSLSRKTAKEKRNILSEKNNDYTNSINAIIEDKLAPF